MPDADIEVMQLDLADLSSIRNFSRAFKSDYDRLHILVNNAGVMATPHRTTADGFELQFGTNHLGHFALTGLLFDILLRTPKSRIVTVSSIAERIGWIKLDDLMSEKFYERWIAYGQSKLANLLFAYELQRRLDTVDASTISVAAHPGFAATDLRNKLMSEETPFFHRVLSILFETMSQSAEKGVLPQLYASTAPDVEGGNFYGPDGLFQRAGYPTEVRSSRKSHDEDLAKKLWAASEALTGITYQALSS
jgi:NAD(P)-dependent dehydrogenase (short-subunit alcohol dehydrogenase family)